VSPTAFSAQATGTVSQSQLGNGLVEVELRLALAGQRLNMLNIRIDGRPLDGGGVEMTSSTVTLGTASAPTQYAGHVTGLDGTNIQARVRSVHGPLGLRARVQIDPSSDAVTGAVTARPGTTRERPERGA